jgi:hypothetical protein
MMKCLAVLALGVAAWVPASQSNMAHPEKFTAFAVNLNSTRSTGTTSSVDIAIDRWSTDAERDQLKNILKEKGQDALLSALQKLPVVGYIRTPTSLRWDLRFARQRPSGDGGRMIFLMTDRPMSSWEAWNQSRSVQYPFTLIQLQLDKDGKGVGKASVATRITEDEDGTIELENFASQPVMLNDVHPEK